jgi:hypothetical protein
MSNHDRQPNGGADPERQRLETAAQELAVELQAHQVPVTPQFFCDDVTPEALTKLLAQHGGRMLVASAEGTLFEIAKGRYGDKKINLDVFLKAHAGDDLRTHRMSRPGEILHQPAVSIAVTVQPSVIRGLAEVPALLNRGLVARCLFAVPTSQVGYRETAPGPIPAEVATEYDRVVKALWTLPEDKDAAGNIVPSVLPFSPAADAAMQEFEKRLEPRLGKRGDLGHMAGWGNKLAGAVARLAAIFHVSEAHTESRPWKGTISEETVLRAIRFGEEYLIAHAKAAFGLMGADVDTERAKFLLEWMTRLQDAHGKRRTQFSRREAHRALGRHIDKVDQLDPVLTLLIRHYYIRPATAPKREGPGRGASPLYEINPHLFADTEGNGAAVDSVEVGNESDGKGSGQEGEEFVNTVSVSTDFAVSQQHAEEESVNTVSVSTELGISQPRESQSSDTPTTNSNSSIEPSPKNETEKCVDTPTQLTKCSSKGMGVRDQGNSVNTVGVSTDFWLSQRSSGDASEPLSPTSSTAKPPPCVGGGNPVDTLPQLTEPPAEESPGRDVPDLPGPLPVPQPPAGVASVSDSLNAQVAEIKRQRQVLAADAPKAQEGVQEPITASVPTSVCAADSRATPAIEKKSTKVAVQGKAAQAKSFPTPVVDSDMEVF